jgi:hypothetical protein
MIANFQTLEAAKRFAARCNDAGYYTVLDRYGRGWRVGSFPMSVAGSRCYEPS